jgi:hypothetical protein
MENARFTALFMIICLLVAYYLTFATTNAPPENADEAVQDQGTNFKGTRNTGISAINPPLSIPMPNWSANVYAGWTPKI